MGVYGVKKCVICGKPRFLADEVVCEDCKKQGRNMQENMDNDITKEAFRIFPWLNPDNNTTEGK